MDHFVRSREHLLHMLAEAAELEHNLLCSYLYAAFSLKQATHEDLLEHELKAVRRWRGVVMGICIEEMAHLAQIANLMVAVGSRPHFDRPNLPVAPGYHPASVQVWLAPFDMDMLEHFVFLERPQDAMVDDAASVPQDAGAVRASAAGALMPSAPDYKTIGEFYALLSEGMGRLAGELGEAGLFVGPANYQLRADEIQLPEISVVTDLATALRALQLIVEQGEGAPGHHASSHFEQFRAIDAEYRKLLDERPGFCPHRPVARNPVMRFPQASDRVHVTGSEAAQVLDAANAVYSLMLRCLAEVYHVPWERHDHRLELLACAMGLMQVLGKLSDVLTTLPASAEEPGVTAGVTFTMLRSTEGLAPGVNAIGLLKERLEHIRRRVPALALPADAADKIGRILQELLA